MHLAADRTAYRDLRFTMFGTTVGRYFFVGDIHVHDGHATGLAITEAERLHICILQLCSKFAGRSRSHLQIVGNRWFLLATGKQRIERHGDDMVREVPLMPVAEISGMATLARRFALSYSLALHHTPFLFRLLTRERRGFCFKYPPIWLCLFYPLFALGGRRPPCIKPSTVC